VASAEPECPCGFAFDVHKLNITASERFVRGYNEVPVLIGRGLAAR
jgi:hypothetical protein